MAAITTAQAYLVTLLALIDLAGVSFYLRWHDRATVTSHVIQASTLFVLIGQMGIILVMAIVFVDAATHAVGARPADAVLTIVSFLAVAGALLADVGTLIVNLRRSLDQRKVSR